ncbi:hypothetical protein B0H13DRAFT_1557393, partial [Mycena leptocephala]
MLRKIAPRAWTTANTMIDTLLAHDPRLHLPFHFPNANGPPQPTAFSRVDYQFSTKGFVHREGPAYIPSMSALTSLGHYDPTMEGELILWTEKKVINFPVGTTFLMPKWLPYSFTSVESPRSQMILSQTCENALCEYVANRFSS